MKKVNLQYFGKRFIYDNVILYMLTRRLQHLSSTSVFSRNLCLSEYCFVDYCSYFSALWRLYCLCLFWLYCLCLFWLYCLCLFWLYCLCLFWLYCLFLFWPLLLSSNLSYRNCEIKTSLNEFFESIPYFTYDIVVFWSKGKTYDSMTSLSVVLLSHVFMITKFDCLFHIVVIHMDISLIEIHYFSNNCVLR